MIKFLMYSVFVLCISCANNPNTVEIIEMPYPPETKEFIRFWKDISQKISNRNNISLENASLDSISTCNQLISKVMFFENCYDAIFDSVQLKYLLDSTKTYFRYYSFTVTNWQNREKLLKNELGEYYGHEVKVSLPDKYYFIMDFIKTTGGYKLSSCNGCCLTLSKLGK